MDITKTKLPQAVKVRGRFYKIHTDFKHMIRFSAILKDRTAAPAAFDFMYKGEMPADRIAGIEAIYNFMNPPRELPRIEREDKDGEIVLDYEKDAELIFAAFLDNYGIDIIDTNLHWYKFTALLFAVHDCKLADVIGYRSYTPSGRNDASDKARRKLYEAWRLPQPEDDEPDEALDDFLNKLNRG